jgi:hypothetical protein
MVSAIEGIDNGSRIPARSVIVFPKIVAVRRASTTNTSLIIFSFLPSGTIDDHGRARVGAA